MEQTKLIGNAIFLRMEDAGNFVLPGNAKVVYHGLINELKPGDHVKITVDTGLVTEKFWCKLLGYDPTTGLMHLQVDNDLSYTLHHGLDDGDELYVHQQYLCAALIN